MCDKSQTDILTLFQHFEDDGDAVIDHEQDADKRTWITTAEAARICGCTPRAVRHWCQHGIVRSQRQSRADERRRARLLVHRVDVEEQAAHLRERRFPSGIWGDRSREAVVKEGHDTAPEPVEWAPTCVPEDHEDDPGCESDEVSLEDRVADLEEKLRALHERVEDFVSEKHAWYARYQEQRQRITLLEHGMEAWRQAAQGILQEVAATTECIALAQAESQV